MEFIDHPWRDFEWGLTEQLEKELEDSGCESLVRMIGILMVRPQCSIAKDEILPSLEYFHVRSGKNISFYFPGYRRALESEADKVITTVDRTKWTFDEWCFDDFRSQLEQDTKWKYSATADLILTNAKVSKTDWAGNSCIDLSSAICADLDHMKEIGAIRSVSSFFEQIFRYAENQDGVDPTWGFSDVAGLRIAGSALKEVLLSLVPKPLRHSVERAAGFAIRDIAATKEEVEAKNPLRVNQAPRCEGQ
jgi:hypothetical protein